MKIKKIKKVNRIITILLTLVIILGLAGCGNNNTQTGASSDDKKEASSEAQEETSNISFETEDLLGNPVKADSVFTKNKVTMVNIWGTTCGPCIQEMPELEKLNKEFAKKGGAIIGVVRDAPLGNNLYLQDAIDIVSDTGVTYLNIRAWDEMESTFSVLGTPTTYFVDSKGNIVGDPVPGANVDKYKETMEKLLSEAQ